MKRGLRIFGAIVLCLLMVSVALPDICLATPGEVEFEDIEAGESGTVVCSMSLEERDEVDVEIDDLDLNYCSYCEVRLFNGDTGNFLSWTNREEGEHTFIVDEDGFYRLIILGLGGDEDDYIECSGSIEW